MPAQPRKRAPRKTTPAKPAEKPTAADAAATEAVGGDGDVTVEFRGEKFTISREARQSWRAVTAIGKGNVLRWFAEVIDPGDYDRLIEVGKPRESFGDVSREFFAAYGQVTGAGNS